MTRTVHRSPLVTIGVPVYNGERFLTTCLDSLLAQTFRDFVLVIADNASTDGTAEIAREYAARDSRVQYRRHAANVGMYGNFNFLLRGAETPYVKLANADDFWAPEMVADALEVLERDPAVALCYPMMTLVDAADRVTERYGKRLEIMEDDPIERFMRVRNELGLISQLMGVMRANVVRRMVSLVNHPASDSLFVTEIALYGKIRQTERFQYFRRFHPDCASFERSSDHHQLTHVYEQGAKEIRWRAWTFHAELMRRVVGSPLSLPDKGRLCAYLARNAAWDRSALLAELMNAGR